VDELPAGVTDVSRIRVELQGAISRSAETQAGLTVSSSDLVRHKKNVHFVCGPLEMQAGRTVRVFCRYSSCLGAAYTDLAPIWLCCGETQADLTVRSFGRYSS
jgi:hypothetical protein